MIIFDTNALRGLNRGNPKFDLLRALKLSGSHPAGIPWMVREELVAKQVLDYAASYKSAAAAINDLNRRTPWGGAARIPNSEIEKAKDYWRGQYEEVLLTLDTRSENTKVALAREAYSQNPAKINPEPKGVPRAFATF